MHGRYLALGSLLLFAALVIACGGDKKDGGLLGGAPAASGSTTPGRQPSPAGSPARGTTPAASSSPAGATPSAAATGLPKLAALGDLTSYRYAVKVEQLGVDIGGFQKLADQYREIGNAPAPRPGTPIVIDVTGAYVKPDKGLIKYTVNGVAVTQTSIGTQQWTQLGTNTNNQTVAAKTHDALVPLADLLGGSVTQGVAVSQAFKCASTPENVSTVPSRRCSVGLEELGASASQNFIDAILKDLSSTVKVATKDVSKLTMTMWVAQTGNYPMRFQFEIAGKDSSARNLALKIDSTLSDVNKPVEIAAPR